MNHLKPLLASTSSFYSGNILSRLIHSSLLPEALNRNFQNSLPTIISRATQEKDYLRKAGIEDNVEKASKYNLQTANTIGGVALLHAYSKLSETDDLTVETHPQAFVLAWAVEMVLSHNFLMDTNRHLEVKEQEAEIVPTSTMDADLLRSFMHLMLDEQFDGNEANGGFLRLYNKAFMYNALARIIEHTSTASCNKYINFNEENFFMLCEYKTVYPSFVLPLSLALKLVRSDDKISINVERLCSQMGKLYQMKIDYDDCFAGETILGTRGSDIQRGRCTWLATTALQRFTARQRIVFSACYGGSEPAHIERIKLLYCQVQLPQLFKERQEKMYDDIQKRVRELENEGIPSNVFLKILDEIVRDKNIPVVKSQNEM